MKKILLKQKQDGFTLVEIMIVLALVGIILALGYMYLDFGVQARDRGEKQAIAQKGARYSADIITGELRFAEEVIINPEGDYVSEEDFEDGYSYFYQDDNSLVHRDEEGTSRVLADSKTDDMPYSIYFTSNVPNDVVYFYIIVDHNLDTDLEPYIDEESYELNEEDLSEEKEYIYLLKTKVQALNLELSRTYAPEDELIKLNDLGGTIIKYKRSSGD